MRNIKVERGIRISGETEDGKPVSSFVSDDDVPYVIEFMETVVHRGKTDNPETRPDNKLVRRGFGGHITVNGEKRPITHTTLTYENLIQSLGYREDDVVSVVWKYPGTDIGGVLYGGESIPLRDGVVINAVVTGNA